jgi:hypothetical protein
MPSAGWNLLAYRENPVNTILLTIYRLSQCMILMGAIASLTAHAQSIDEAMVKQLRELKKLCDDGLLSREVCIEKQRSILHLHTTAPEAGGAWSQTREGAQTGPRDFDGLSFTLPEGWKSLDLEQMGIGFKVLRSQLQDADEAQQHMQKLESAMKTAGTQMFSKPGATLLVRPQASTLQTSPESVHDLCEQIAKVMSVGQKRVLHDCGLLETAGNKAIYLEHDSFANGARTMMYLAAIGPGKTVQLVLNSENDSFEANKLEVDGIVASLRWK